MDYTYLKKEFGNNYSNFVKWFYEQKVIHGNLFSFVEYKDLYIVSIDNIITDDKKPEFIKDLKRLNLNLNDMKIKFNQDLFNQNN